MRNYDVILFDLDGTLTDSAPGILNSVRYACRKLAGMHDNSCYFEPTSL